MSEGILSIGELLGVGGGVAPSALSAYIPFSGLNYSGEKITGISGSAIAGGVESSVVSSIVSSMVSGKVDQSAFDDCCSSVKSSLSSKMDASASGKFYPGGNPSGFITGVDLSPYQEKSGMSAYMPASSSGDFYPKTGNPSGFLTAHQSLSGYIPTSESSKYQPKSSISSWTGQMQYISAKVDKSAISAQSAVWNTVSGKADASAVGSTYTGISPINVNNTTKEISLQATPVGIDSSLRTYNSGGSALVGLTYPIAIVAQSSQATGSNIIYVVTGS